MITVRPGGTSRRAAIMLALLGLAGLVGCAGMQPSPLVVEGRLRPAGMTSFMYGTHLLFNTEGTIMYAVRGPDQPLDDFNHRTVRIEGRRVEGYPIEGGPPLIEVTDIRVVPVGEEER